MQRITPFIEQWSENHTRINRKIEFVGEYKHVSSNTLPCELSLPTQTFSKNKFKSHYLALLGYFRKTEIGQ